MSSARPVYLVSDIHLGAAPKERERSFLRWLSHAGSSASELIINGDLFDFWFEYRSVIPRGHTRVLGALAALVDADMVKGSRWVPGGSVVNWPKSRELISRGGSLWTRLMLGIGLRDATGGFNAFRASTLRTIGLDDIASAGYCFQIDLAWRALQAGFRVVEVPITFTERERGSSKMSNAIVAEALWKVTQWGVTRHWTRVRRHLPAFRNA